MKRFARGRVEARRLGSTSTAAPYTFEFGALFKATDHTRPRDTGKTYKLDSGEGFFLDPGNGVSADEDALWRKGTPNQSSDREHYYEAPVPLYYEYVAGKYVMYWICYAYNNFAPAEELGQHEGDWERIAIQLDANDEPLKVHYYSHEAGMTVGWPLVEKAEGTHVKAFIAKGSHAAYPAPDTYPLASPVHFDTAAADGPQWETWKGALVSVREQPWYGFGGAWGEVGEDFGFWPLNDPGLTTGPVGPSPYKSAGDVVREWIPPLVQFSSTAYGAPENGGPTRITIMREGSTAQAGMVSFAVESITALIAVDFDAPYVGTVSFAKGERFKTVPIAIRDDTLDEPDETFRVTLFSPTAGLGVGANTTTTVTIFDDDFDASPTLKRPVVLVKGMYNRSNFTNLKRVLQERGYDVRGPFDISPEGKAGILDSAAYVREELERQFPGMSPVDIDIVAHSAGGLVSRTIIGDQRINRRENGSQLVRVHNLITLGTPLGGTLGAGLVTELIRNSPNSGGLRDLAGDILADLDAGAAFANGRYDDVPGTRYWRLGGDEPSDYGEEFPWLYRFAAVAEPRLYDGLVNVMSVRGDYPGSTKSPPAEPRFRIIDGVNHGNLPQDMRVILDYVLPALSDSCERWPEAVTGVQGNATARRTAAQAVAAVQPQLVAAALLPLSEGGNRFTAPIDSAAKATFTVLATTPGAVSLRSPDGRVLPGTSLGGGYLATTGAGFAAYSLTVPNPLAGTWTVDFTPTAIPPANAEFLVQASVQNALALEDASMPRLYLAETPRLRVRLLERGKRIANATVTASLKPASAAAGAVTLFDDGQHDDGAAQDGVYGARLDGFTGGGLCRVTFSAAGTTAAGQAFQRVARSSFATAASGAKLEPSGHREHAVDVNSDGIFETLRAEHALTVTHRGRFFLTAELRDSSGARIARGAVSTEILEAGTHIVAIDFDGFAIAKSGSAGPYTVANIQLLAMGDSRPELIQTDSGGFATGAYESGDFGSPPTAAITTPLAVNVKTGAHVRLSVSAGGTPPLTYQWQHNAVALPDQTEAQLELAQISAEQAGMYTVVVKNSFGSVSSAATLVKVAPARSFVAYRGTYQALVEPDAPSFPTIGFLQLVVGAEGSFTGSIRRWDGLYRVKGIFDDNGSYHGAATASARAELPLKLKVDLDGNNEITGTIAEVPFVAARAAADTTPGLKWPAAKFTLFLPVPDEAADAALFPPGDAFATLVVSERGVARVVGVLTDGTPFAQSAVLSHRNSFPVYVPAKKATSVTGRIRLQPTSGPTLLEGSASWWKQRADKGWAFRSSVFDGATYTPPISALPAADFAAPSARVVLDLRAKAPATGLEVELVCPAANQFVLATAAGTALKIQFLTKTGLYTGDYSDPASDVKVSFRGAVSQPSNKGRGFYRGTASGLHELRQR